MQPPQLIARDIYQSFRMGPRRIEVLRGISMQIERNEAVFLSGCFRRRQNDASLHISRSGASRVGNRRIRRPATIL